MSRMSFRDDGEEHNFWQNYTDLMSGFLIVFILTSLMAYGGYKKYVDLYNQKGITEANINDFVVNAELYRKIRNFQNAQKTITRKNFQYQAKYQRFECTVDVQFAPDSPIIPQQNIKDLINAGREIKSVIDTFSKSSNVSFKVVIEGRAAKPFGNPNPNAAAKAYASKLSYERARNLYLLWQNEGLIKNIEKNGEVLISGTGYGGKGRHPYRPGEEEKNKTFIIQIIPYVTF